MGIPLHEIIGMAYVQASNEYDNEELFYDKKSLDEAFYKRQKLRQLYSLAAGKTSIEVYIITCNGKVSQQAYDSLSKAQHFIESRSDKPEKADEYTFIAGANKYEIHPVNVK